jgi:hypothetical protein
MVPVFGSLFSRRHEWFVDWHVDKWSEFEM